MKSIYLPILVFVMLLSGCSGFMMQTNRESTTTEPISNSAYKVTFCGAGYMPKMEAEKSAMQRASELTLKKGFTHFAIIEQSVKSGTDQLEDIPRSTYQQGMKQSSGEKLAGPQNLVRPTISLKIQCYSIKDAPSGAIDAKQYLNDNPLE
jgi:PBP1b-binding outer membrane lipoprotein LpoB